VLDILTAQDTAVEVDKLDGLYRILGSDILLLDEDIPGRNMGHYKVETWSSYG
jgi:hypothetical protein